MRNPATTVAAYAKGGALRITVLVLAVLAVLACAGAGWFGLSWYRAAHDESLELAATRDVVLREAQQVAVNLNTLDFERVEQTLDQWEQSSTGQVAEEYRRNRESYARAMTEARAKTEARVLEAAVAELDPRAGTALVLVAADVTVTAQQGAPTVQRQRLQIGMTRTGQGWKASALASLDARPR